MKFYSKGKKENFFYKKLHSLNDLAIFFETDKGDIDKNLLPWGKDWPSHECWGYTKIYEKYMEEKRESPVKFFEIGICDKRFPYGSLKTWLSYFKDIDLYGMDNFWGSYLEDKSGEIKEINEYGVNFIYADQGNLCDWEEIKQNCPRDFDFIVEDGSHWPNHMIISLWQARDMIKPGGYYFMEDLQNPRYSRGKHKYDNSLLTEDLLMAEHTGIIKSSFLHESQNEDLQNNFELVEMFLDKSLTHYLAVFRKK